MEAFHLLSRGGAKFDKKRFQKDVQLFKPDVSQPKPSAVLNGLAPGELPAELDFFKYAAGNSASKASKGKGKEADRDEDPADDSDDDLGASTSTKKRKRSKEDGR